MKLLQALFFPPEQPGGVSSMIPYLQDKFEPPEWDIELFSLPKRIRGKGTDEIKFYTFDWRQYEHSTIVQKYMQTYRDYLWWTKLRLQQSYDLIHAHHPIAGLAMKEVYPDTPVIQSIHSSYERELILNRKIKEGGPEHRFLCSLYKELEHRADRMFTVSESFRGYLSPHVDHPEQIGVIHNGFDNKRFKPIPHHNDVVQLVTVCRLVPAKGLDVLLRACAELKKRGLAYVLHIIGDGPIREELEQLAAELGIYDETIFYGYTLHPEEFMPFFDIFVLPSRAEAFGSVFAEAALCNLALVGTEIGGIAEQIEHGVNGLLVHTGDHSALAGALEKLITDEDYRTRLADAGLDKAKNCYSLDRVVDELKNIYLQYKQSSE
ncbi:hypothetical protein YSY43_07090 [Paenibacillus sp. YSY-4.3]